MWMLWLLIPTWAANFRKPSRTGVWMASNDVEVFDDETDFSTFLIR
jgi:hypothetical protein